MCDITHALMLRTVIMLTEVWYSDALKLCRGVVRQDS